ncbi:hypothetical protein [Rubrobacter radiotolerans]|uniref:hypothetical protein n=1 Tax=Rubrobacter radiotolerans TaxID=42256 RepID=UPI00117A7918|nr:hypothetical protein [Rubrobacter radiotolerans]
MALRRIGEELVFGVFRTERIPSLSRIPKEVGREVRTCERCGVRGEHILYVVPKKVAFLYFRNHARNLHATCLSCAGSTLVTSPERERVLASGREGRGSGKEQESPDG